MSGNIDLMKDCQRFVAMTPEELTQLDRECAEALGIDLIGGKNKGVRLPRENVLLENYTPTTNPAQWAELLERFDFGLMSHRHREGKACDKYYLCYWTHPTDSVHYRHCEEGPTPGIAIVRAVIAKSIGTT